MFNLKLSIITVNLNNIEGLRNTINSVVSQTYKDFEWIIIDGGSTDGSKELIEKYDDYVDYWISEPDKGIFNAMNKGIKASRGEYILFLNSGDYLASSDKLEYILPLLSDKDFYIGDLEINGGVYHVDISNTERLCASILNNKSIPHQGTFSKRNLFERFGLYREDKKIVSDWIFFFEAVVFHNASVGAIPFVVSVFENNRPPEDVSIMFEERSDYLLNYPVLKNMTDFYYRYYRPVKSICENKLFHKIGRMYIRFKKI